ncbi:MAG: hypothetical protein IKN38_00810 [Clostridia bacterium]|nr:hypothetical protein [Clostridia bacterium]
MPNFERPLDRAVFYCDRRFIIAAPSQIATYVWAPELVAEKCGDVDGDGVVGLKDISHLKAYIAGIVDVSEISRANSDVDSDGAIGLKDISALKALIAG